MNIREFQILLVLTLAVLTQTACSNSTLDTKPDSGAVVVEDVQSGQTQWVDPNKLQRGPIQRETLTAEQLQRIAAIRETFVEIDDQTIEQWVDNFKRDLNPDNELAIWERMAKAYSRYCDTHQLDLDIKKEVYKVVLLRSMTSPNDVIAKLELTKLSEQDARDVMAEF